MTTTEQFHKILNKSLKEGKTDPFLHLAEEMSELITEILKGKRDRVNRFKYELSHVFFQMLKAMKTADIEIKELMQMIIDETKTRFPHMME